VEETTMERLTAVSHGTLRTDLPVFDPGDTVRVMVRVREGDKERLHRLEARLRLEHHPGSAPVGVVVDGVMPVVGEIPELHQPELDPPFLSRPADDAEIEPGLERFGEQRHHVDPKGRLTHPSALPAAR